MTDSSLNRTRSASATTKLIDAGRALTSADYDIACAATLLERASFRDDWRDRADKLMRDCIALREEIATEVGR